MSELYNKTPENRLTSPKNGKFSDQLYSPLQKRKRQKTPAEILYGQDDNSDPDDFLYGEQYAPHQEKIQDKAQPATQEQRTKTLAEILFPSMATSTNPIFAEPPTTSFVAKKKPDMEDAETDFLGNRTPPRPYDFNTKIFLKETPSSEEQVQIMQDVPAELQSKIKERKPKWIDAPVITDETERRNAILSDLPARFEIEIDSDAETSRGREWIDIQSLGREAVKENNDYIEEAAQTYNLDPDLIRAVMFSENAVGHKGGANILADKYDRSTSRLPMNIQQKMWHKIIDANPDDLKKPKENIFAAAKLLKSIETRTENPTIAMIGTLWNELSAKKTNSFGHYIERAYNDKKWKKR